MEMDQGAAIGARQEPVQDAEDGPELINLTEDSVGLDESPAPLRPQSYIASAMDNRLLRPMLSAEQPQNQPKLAAMMVRDAQGNIVTPMGAPGDERT